MAIERRSMAPGILAFIKQMTPEDRRWLFKKLEQSPELFAETGYAIGPVKGQRRPSQILAMRGLIVLDAQKNKGVSWSKMPEYVLANHPDWFPQHAGKRLSDAQHEALVEKLRTWARRVK